MVVFVSLPPALLESKGLLGPLPRGTEEWQGKGEGSSLRSGDEARGWRRLRSGDEARGWRKRRKKEKAGNKGTGKKGGKDQKGKKGE